VAKRKGGKRTLLSGRHKNEVGEGRNSIEKEKGIVFRAGVGNHYKDSWRGGSGGGAKKENTGLLIYTGKG